MDKLPENIDQLFLQLVLSLQASAMQQLGKITSPFTGEIEKDLKAAKFTIDVLNMLDVKMKGNLSDEEAKVIKHVLYELRLNYVDETQKEDSESDKLENPDGRNSEQGTNNN